MSLLNDRGLRLRLWWTAMLVLVALGGAGLAVAADRPHNPLERPELTWAADRAAEPHLQQLGQELQAADEHVQSLSDHGRQVLGRLTALDVAAVDAALVAGDAAALALIDSNAEVAAVRTRADQAIDEWRLGPDTLAQTEALDSAATSVGIVPDYWQRLAAEARRVANLVDTLLRHDGLVFRATTAGRHAEWQSALDFLAQAKTPLDEAKQIRDILAATADVETLDDLLGRYRAYDAALNALYTHIRDTGNQQGSDFDALEREVELRQAALPADTSAMTVIVADAAGPAVTDALVDIEAAHGDVLDAIAALDATETAE